MLDVEQIAVPSGLSIVFTMVLMQCMQELPYSQFAYWTSISREDVQLRHSITITTRTRTSRQFSQ